MRDVGFLGDLDADRMATGITVPLDKIPYVVRRATAPPSDPLD